MNLAIRLSLSRIGLSFIFMICLLCPTLFSRVAALFFFIMAVITDIYDGSWARSRDMVTPLGMLLDPLADKILVSAAFISFVGMDEIWVPAWMVVIIIAREFCIMGLRLLACGGGKVLPAEKAGKQKTIMQMAAIIIILLYLIARTVGRTRGLWNDGLEAWGRTGVFFVMFVTVILTVLSGYFYLNRHRNIFWK